MGFSLKGEFIFFLVGKLDLLTFSACSRTAILFVSTYWTFKLNGELSSQGIVFSNCLGFGDGNHDQQEVFKDTK